MAKTFFRWVCVALVAFAISFHCAAEQKETLGSWDVHYIAFGSTFITPEIAKNYGIVRSKYNAIVNISVLDSDSQAAQHVSMTGKATNLIGTTKALTFKKVTEGDAIYYLASLKFDNMETYRFEINIQRGNENQTLKFSQKMYVD